MKALIPLGLLAMALAGCGSGSDEALNESAKPIGGALPMTKGVQEPPPMQAAGEDATLSEVELGALEKQQSEAQAAFEKDPKNEQAKAKFIEVSNKYAYELMMAQYVPPRERYPKSLRIYRKVLEVDPDNEVALKWKKQIEEIYKGMGRDIPE